MEFVIDGGGTYIPMGGAENPSLGPEQSEDPRKNFNGRVFLFFPPRENSTSLSSVLLKLCLRSQPLLDLVLGSGFFLSFLGTCAATPLALHDHSKRLRNILDRRHRGLFRNFFFSEIFLGTSVLFLPRVRVMTIVHYIAAGNPPALPYRISGGD